jgi:hypothetical protein
MKTEEKINSDYVVGAICYKGIWRFYFMPPIYWVTDSDYYDPGYNSQTSSDSEFRRGVGKLHATNADIYIKSIEDDGVSSSWINENYLIYKDDLKPVFLVDIDNHLFVSKFYDVDYENHVAPRWQGVFGDPLEYMPDEIKKIWN